MYNVLFGETRCFGTFRIFEGWEGELLETEDYHGTLKHSTPLLRILELLEFSGSQKCTMYFLARHGVLGLFGFLRDGEADCWKRRITMEHQDNQHLSSGSLNFWNSQDHKSVQCTF